MKHKSAYGAKKRIRFLEKNMITRKEFKYIR